MTAPAPSPAAPPAPVPPPRRWPYFLLLLLVFVIWSNSFIAVRVLVGEPVPEAERLGPLEFVAVRFTPVALFCGLWFLTLKEERRRARELLRGWRALLVVALGMFNVWGYNLAFAAGHRLVPAGTGSLIITLNPVLTWLFALAAGMERFAAARAAGLAVAFTGVYLVVTRGADQAVTTAYVQGALLLACAPVSWALYTVLGKGLLARSQPQTLTYLALGLGSAPVLLVAALSPELHAKIAVWQPERFGAALFLSLGCTLFAFWLWFVALRHLKPSTTAAFVFLNPPLTLLFEWIWFRRVPNWGLLGGGALILFGVYLVISRRLAPLEVPRVRTDS